MSALTIDGASVPVLAGSWRMRPLQYLSRNRTETGALRTVVMGGTQYEFEGASVFATRIEADALLGVLDTPGDHIIDGDLPGQEFTVETVPGDIEALDHRPDSGPTMRWKLSWRLLETTATIEES